MYIYLCCKPNFGFFKNFKILIINYFELFIDYFNIIKYVLEYQSYLNIFLCYNKHFIIL